jgi:hypothetical protein
VSAFDDFRAELDQFLPQPESERAEFLEELRTWSRAHSGEAVMSLILGFAYLLAAGEAAQLRTASVSAATVEGSAITSAAEITATKPAR